MNTENQSALQKGKIFVFSAPSGAGKTTLLDYLRDTIPGLIYSISATTRKPRPGEINGQHYFFMSEKEFRARSERSEFAEWQLVHGNYYGTPRSFIDSTIGKGLHIIMDIDVFGKKKFDVYYPQAIGILVLPPSMEILEKRLRGRGTDDEETVSRRIANAREEVAFAHAQGKYEFIITNDNLEKAKLEVAALVRSQIEKI